MRIVQFLHGNKIGGMEKFCIDLSNALSHEHDVLLLADKTFKKYVETSVQFVELDIEKSRNNIFFLWKIWKILKAFSPDIIQVHKQNTINILKRLKPFLKIPFVATKHDMQIKKAFYGLRYAITIAEETRSTIKADYIYKIYNGVPFHKPKKIILPDGFNIVAVGGLREVKGYDKLLYIVADLDFNYHLTILGEGSQRERLEALIDTLDLKEKVTLAGFKSNINDYLYSADLQVITSLSEGFSLAMIEGLFYSKVLLSTKVSGCTEILSEGLLTDIEAFHAKIKMVFENYDAYEAEFIKLKNKYSQRLTIEACKDEHIKVYRNIISKDNI
ncbi:Poly(glycerol-phosphate) alpha-glucosyltransferase [hydrothermal vent metagenome]|uniref:Poly(Glycerol-phosphate) alpha-glucosyltransferase n=1 Tax=hydrothermal vent metagenome TaxID=652676 RepID=A0A1W1CUT4_9ZZZZ